MFGLNVCDYQNRHAVDRLYRIVRRRPIAHMRWQLFGTHARTDVSVMR